MDKNEWLKEYTGHVNAFNEFRDNCKNLENYDTIKSLLGGAVEYLYHLGEENGYTKIGVEQG